MAKRPNFKCRACGYESNSPHEMGRHYREHPDHRQKVAAKKAEQQAEQGQRAPGLRFCPCCGLDLGRVQEAMRAA